MAALHGYFSDVREFDVGNWTAVDNLLNVDSSGGTKLTINKDWLNVYCDVRNVKERKYRGNLQLELNFHEMAIVDYRLYR